MGVILKRVQTAVGGGRAGHRRATVGTWSGRHPCFESLQRTMPFDRRCEFSALGARAPFGSVGVCDQVMTSDTCTSHGANPRPYIK